MASDSLSVAPGAVGDEPPLRADPVDLRLRVPVGFALEAGGLALQAQRARRLPGQHRWVTDKLLSRLEKSKESKALFKIPSRRYNLTHSGNQYCIFIVVTRV